MLALGAEPTHPNVIKFLGGSAEPGGLHTVWEYAANGSLQAYLKVNHWRMQSHVLLKLLTDIAAGMAFVHSRGVIHRDLKADNILLDGAGQCKIVRHPTIFPVCAPAARPPTSPGPLSMFACRRTLGWPEQSVPRQR